MKRLPLSVEVLEGRELPSSLQMFSFLPSSIANHASQGNSGGNGNHGNGNNGNHGGHHGGGGEVTVIPWHLQGRLLGWIRIKL